MQFPFPADVLLALAAFSFVSSVTPGPNNFMLLASGVNFGFTRSIPHMIGIASGFCFMLVCVGFGLGEIFERAPLLYQGLKFVGAAYLLYLAWKIANSGPVASPEGSGTEEQGTPMTFLQAAAFQWVNPKAWFMAVTSMSVYTVHTNFVASVLGVAAVFTAINLPSISMWCGMGTGLRSVLSDPVKLRYFNWIMGGLLVASLWPMLK